MQILIIAYKLYKSLTFTANWNNLKPIWYEQFGRHSVQIPYIWTILNSCLVHFVHLQFDKSRFLLHIAEQNNHDSESITVEVGILTLAKIFI